MNRIVIEPELSHDQLYLVARIDDADDGEHEYYVLWNQVDISFAH